ncbi:hypothetical protein J6590_042792 [Homalodisca vitripennis]|nr:hypothetical protein J6590_042792 [Homalodisca vitripennis]
MAPEQQEYQLNLHGHQTFPAPPNCAAEEKLYSVGWLHPRVSDKRPSLVWTEVDLITTPVLVFSDTRLPCYHLDLPNVVRRITIEQVQSVYTCSTTEQVQSVYTCRYIEHVCQHNRTGPVRLYVQVYRACLSAQQERFSPSICAGI